MVQPSQNDRDELALRGLGRHAAGCRKGVEAVAREFVRHDIIPDLAVSAASVSRPRIKPPELLLPSGDVLTSMHERPEFGAVVLVGNERGAPGGPAKHMRASVLAAG